MSNEVAVKEPPSVIADMAARYGMDKRAFEATIRATAMPANVQVSNEQFVAFLMVAREYGLNPLTKEIFAFPSRGGIQPIVSIDGWCNIINSHPNMNGMEFEDIKDDKGNITAITCRLYRKDREKPVETTEYMSECKRATDTWKQWPVRMLRHKALIQCARYAFGFSGIVDQDEAERMLIVTEDSNTDHMTGEPKKVSFWKSNPLRNSFVREVQDLLNKAKNEAEIDRILELNKEKLDGMRSAGDSRDELALDSIQNVEKLARDRVAATITDVQLPSPHPVEDGGLSAEEMATWEAERASYGMDARA